MRQKIVGAILVLTILVSTALYYTTNGNYNTYDIKHPAKGKHHAIIKIEFPTVGDKEGHSCTAFVIDDNRAVTAGHCVYVTEAFLEAKYKTIMKASDEKVIKLQKYLDSLLGCMTFKCQSDYNYFSSMLKQEQADRVKTKALKVDVFTVINSYGENTKIKASPLYKNMDNRDYAILKGDFKKFEKLPVREGFHIKENDILKTCGYAGGTTPPICTEFMAIGNHVLMYKGYGFMISGMSGGPVVDKFGLVVGINSSVMPDFVVMDTLVGVFNRKYARPRVKKKKETGPH